MALSSLYLHTACGKIHFPHLWCLIYSDIGEGNGNPLQCSCLENPRDGGAWWAAVYGVAQSWTRLKRFSSSSTYSDAGKDWRQERGTTEDEMVGWHHQLDGHEFEQAPGVGDGQGSLACCSPWGCRVGHDWTTELNAYKHLSPLGSNFCEGRCHFAIWTTSPSPALAEFSQNRHSVSIVSKNQAYPKRFGIMHDIQKNEQQVLNITLKKL